MEEASKHKTSPRTYGIADFYLHNYEKLLQANGTPYFSDSIPLITPIVRKIRVKISRVCLEFGRCEENALFQPAATEIFLSKEFKYYIEVNLSM